MENNIKASSQRVRQQEEIILKSIPKFPGGATIDEIMEASNLELELRTFQRRLETLLKAGKIIRLGQTRGIRYQLNLPLSGEYAENGQTEREIPLSENARAILSMLSIPEIERKQVGYNRTFLESYHPNRDFYLTAAERGKLAEMGQIPGATGQLAGTYAKEILQRLLIDLSWNSSRMEGNRYSLLDTKRLIEKGQAANNKSALEAQMILNHKDAIEFIVQSAEEIGYNRYTILNLHGLLAHNLLPDSAAAGRLRKIPVGIKKSVYTPLSIPRQIEEMFEVLLEKASAIEDSFEQAFFILVHLPYLQPFEDVNKRVSRLAVNIAFNRSNLSPLSFIDVPSELYIQGLLGVYELNRIDLLKDVFIWAYDRSSSRYSALRQTIGEPDPFKLKYGSLVKELITEIVSKAYQSELANKIILAKSILLPEKDRSKFIEVVETELLSLHEGNFARYYIRPSEFKIWKEAWAK